MNLCSIVMDWDGDAGEFCNVLITKDMRLCLGGDDTPTNADGTADTVVPNRTIRGKCACIALGLIREAGFACVYIRVTV